MTSTEKIINDILSKKSISIGEYKNILKIIETDPMNITENNFDNYIKNPEIYQWYDWEETRIVNKITNFMFSNFTLNDNQFAKIIKIIDTHKKLTGGILDDYWLKVLHKKKVKLSNQQLIQLNNIQCRLVPKFIDNDTDIEIVLEHLKNMYIGRYTDNNTINLLTNIKIQIPPTFLIFLITKLNDNTNESSNIKLIKLTIQKTDLSQIPYIYTYNKCKM